MVGIVSGLPAGKLWIALAILASHTAGCEVDEDCSLNGACTAGACACFAPWAGESCGLLSFEPGPSVSGYGVAPRVNAWGGNAIFFEGQWHLWVSEMSANCSLADWYRNSQVVHAVASSPVGPFARTDVALPVFAHEPQASLSWLADGTPQFALWHVGTADGGSNPNNCSSGARADEAAALPPRGRSAAASSTLHVATSPFGPWTPVPNVPDCNNPSQAQHRNGTVFLLCNNAANQRETNATLFSAPSIEGPYSIAGFVAGPSPDANVPEDGFLFFDARGNWHVIYHTYTFPGEGVSCANPPDCDPTSISGHSFSRDGLSWTVSPLQPYFNVANFSDAPALHMSTRERPHLIFAEDGVTPVALSNGICPVPHCPPQGAIECKISNNNPTYTLIVPLAI
jgi:hypothetical protein